jgi:GDP-L-fucose synthase
MRKDSRIYVAGHRGMVGSALLRRLEQRGYSNIIIRTKEQLDLRDAQRTRDFFEEQKPEYVFLAAARVGGIWANAQQKAGFFYDNISISVNVIHAARESGVHKLLNLGSSCMYPRLARQPIKEEYLLTGPLEPTNEAYAIAKISALKMCEYYNSQYGTNFLTIMPTNLYGPNDNFDLDSSHVLPAILRKTHEAKAAYRQSVELWGDGTPRREFLYVDDLAEAAVFLMERFSHSEIGGFVNVGTGQDVTVRELADLVAEIVGFGGEYVFDRSKPNGMPRKLLDVSRIHELGWTARTPLREGIQRTYAWYLANR